ncbi:glutamate synthase subunit beta [Rhodococcus sp. D2-41]|uniref:Glutamate synthase subunit beta n=1 Tax=Speluncibacter jeojiensis TaxID=2710754 RepID=A0A9X4RCJ3_9ACTN|nr:glutamate synthase subunit beta [Rhodococcus sp. D2-41]MDG3012084.1 glutamate synthase subunit beta [Rhodococcus sp. D2-41]MDG3013609.1 glutamate synthase subunit beta [Corynebacteriales bacterium D3-21]
MADPKGFLTTPKREAQRRPVDERITDWREVYVREHPRRSAEEVSEQAGRCMDCGIPFCHSGAVGCPLGNLIPEWNDLARRGRWPAAADRLHATNNFPEVTGRICPAPCEAACVLSIAEDATGGSVTIKRIERTIADLAIVAGIEPQFPEISTGRRVAVVGSGPAGLAAAQQLTRAGHDVTVYERDDRLGGLLRYGIPEYKLEKAVVDQRLAQMRAEGTHFRTECEVGVDLTVEQLRAQFDAVVLAVGALRARDDRDLPGRDLDGIHLAMTYLVASNHECEGDGPTPISARGRHVVIIGGGDTAADCLGTAHRQGAASVTQLDLYPRPPVRRDEQLTPWPTWPLILRVTPAHAEGGVRRHAVAVRRFLAEPRRGHLRAIELVPVSVRKDDDGAREVTETGEPWQLDCDLALLAIGFAGVEHMPLLGGIGVALNRDGVLDCDPRWGAGAPGVFACGDAHRGASLVVWAIAEGRAAARAVDEYLAGDSDLPAPVTPDCLPLTAR